MRRVNSEFMNPVESIKSEFHQRNQANPSYSLRAFARDLGVSHSYLSLILNHKRKISLKRALEFRKRFRYQQLDLNDVIEDARLQIDEEDTKVQEPSTPFYHLTIDMFSVINDWYHIAILDLTQIKGFKSDAKWIARRLHISTSQVKEAIARLVRLGLLKEENKRWVKTHKKLDIPTEYGNESLIRYHQQMIAKASAALLQPIDGKHPSRNVSGTTIPVNPERLAQAASKITRFHRNLMKFLSEGECTELYQLNVQFFQLSK